MIMIQNVTHMYKNMQIEGKKQKESILELLHS
jgi:hypothetical protein